MFRPAFAALILLLSSAILPAAERSGLRAPVEGPVEAELISVIDGDTLLVEARPWPQHRVVVLVRIRGIDAPELKAGCESARRAAIRARKRLAGLAQGRIRLSNISGDKYFGRVLATVSAGAIEDVGSSLLAAGLVSSYDGRHKAVNRCRSETN